MARVLHLFKGDHATEAGAVIARALVAGDHVDLALLAGAAAPTLPGGVAVHRVPEEVSYDQLLELVFAADSVVTW